MNLTEWNALSQVIYNFIAAFAAFVTPFAAGWAIWVYSRNSKLERARWLTSLYEKFYEEERLKRVRDRLDCEAGNEQVSGLVSREPPEFTDYLNFFEFMAVLKENKQLKDRDIEDMFGYYLRCLKQQESVRSYIGENKNGYEKLKDLLNELK